MFHAPGSGVFHAPGSGVFHAPGSGVFHAPGSGVFHAPGSGVFHAPGSGVFHAPTPEHGRPRIDFRPPNSQRSNGTEGKGRPKSRLAKPLSHKGR